MNTQRTTVAAILTCLGVLLAGMATARATKPGAHGEMKIALEPKQDLQIWIWPDRGEGAAYRDGDPISFYVETTRDCFLILYNIDTRGRLRILFPADPWDDNFVPAGESIRFPRPQDPYDWRVDGPSGVEYVQAIASEFPIPLPDWPIYLRSVNGDDAVCEDPELRDFSGGDDRLAYIETVNHKVTGRFWDWCATDLATFYVQPRHHIQVTVCWDPWPDVYYGEIYIGWPIGGRIFVDGIYVGIAPLWIPRHHYGRHEVTCYVGSRLARRHSIEFRPKREYRDRVLPDYHGYDLGAHGHVKAARRGLPPQADFDRVRTRVPRREITPGHPVGSVAPEHLPMEIPPKQVDRHPSDPTTDVGVVRTRDARPGEADLDRVQTRVPRHEISPGRPVGPVVPDHLPLEMPRQRLDRHPSDGAANAGVIRTGDIRRGERVDRQRREVVPAPISAVGQKKHSSWWKSVTAVVKGAAEDLGVAVDKPGKDHRSGRAKVDSRSAKAEKSAARASEKPSGSAVKKARPKRD